MTKNNGKNSPRLVMILSLISAGVLLIFWGCKKEPSEQAATETQSSTSQQAAPSQQTTQAKTSQDDGLFGGPRRSLREVVASARTWGPALSSWYGKQAPDFNLTDLNGKQHKLSDYRGRNVLIIFWAPWCGPCRLETPHLIELRNTVSEDKLAMLAISYTGSLNSLNAVRKFVADNKINYDVIAVDRGVLMAPYNMVNSIPSSFYIDPQGKIKLATMGLQSLDDVKAVLQAK